MKRIKIMTVTALLCGSLAISSCIGTFGLTNKVLDWNRGVGDKWINELVFIALNVVPVYEISLFIDGVILNTIEFWTGSNPIAAGQTQKIQGNNAEYMVVSTEDGYNVSCGDKSMDLTFNQENSSWNVAINGKNRELFRINADGTATLSNGKNVSMNAAGMLAARESIGSFYFAAR